MVLRISIDRLFRAAWSVMRPTLLRLRPRQIAIAKPKIVLILRDKRDQAADNGVWLATTEDQHRSLQREFPNMRSIQVLGADAQDFEEAALHACDLILAGDPRIGKVPRKRRASRSAPKKVTKSSKQAKAPNRTAKARKMQ